MCFGNPPSQGDRSGEAPREVKNAGYEVPDRSVYGNSKLQRMTFLSTQVTEDNILAVLTDFMELNNYLGSILESEKNLKLRLYY